MATPEAAGGPVSTSLAPWLSVPDGPAALDYYRKAFGAVERHRHEDESGRVVVAQLAIGRADFWIQEDTDVDPPVGGGRVRMILTVNDPDTVYRRAVEAGASEVAPIYEGHGWRIGRFADPFGHHWEVGRPIPEATD